MIKLGGSIEIAFERKQIEPPNSIQKEVSYANTITKEQHKKTPLRLGA